MEFLSSSHDVRRLPYGHKKGERMTCDADRTGTKKPNVDVRCRSYGHKNAERMTNQIRNEGNKIIKDLWQNRWNDSENARWTKNLIDEVNVDRLSGDFYINQILTAHGVFREHQARFFKKTSLCSCGQETGSVLHVIKECEIWTSHRKNWPSGWQLMSLKDLINNAVIRISLRGLLHELLIKELDLLSSSNETDVSRH
ncbi:hypothetical protein AVEN_205175-1 [Araneus ventricosus]|uniref:Uncharacterized protein n=1 Tax=Araneus ventricosus TaxID=182803 RepID=A0A4Y2P9K0_ARAVE|nr:hypothetical protein AVEN_205175-1 [Araneus ventricosus]